MLNDLLFAVSDDDDESVPGRHLIEGIGTYFERFIIENEEDNCSLFRFIAFNQGNGPMFHFTGSQSLSMNVVKLLNFKSSLFRNWHGLSHSEKIDGFFFPQKISNNVAIDLHFLYGILHMFRNAEKLGFH